MNREQRMAALAKANEIRLGRAELKRELRDGNVTLAGALEHPVASSMLVFDLLRAQWHWGEIKARKTTRNLMIPDSRRVCGLSGRQKQALVQACEGSDRG